MTPKETVTKYWEAYTKHDQAGILLLLAPDSLPRSPLSGGAATKDMVAGGLKLFEKSFPDLKEEVTSMIVEGDRVACEVMETATFTGSLDWPTGAIAPTNKSGSRLSRLSSALTPRRPIEATELLGYCRLDSAGRYRCKAV